MKKDKDNREKMTVEDAVGPRPRPVWTVVVTAGLLAIVAGTLWPILTALVSGHPETAMTSDTFRYIYAGGAALTVIGRLFSPYRGKSRRVRRLCRIETWSSIFFAVAAFFLFYDDTTRNWLAFTLAGGAIQIYASLMIPRAIRASSQIFIK